MASAQGRAPRAGRSDTGSEVGSSVGRHSHDDQERSHRSVALHSGNLDDVPCSSSARCRFGGSLGEAPHGRGVGQEPSASAVSSVSATNGSASDQHAPSVLGVEKPGSASVVRGRGGDRRILVPVRFSAVRCPELAHRRFMEGILCRGRCFLIGRHVFRRAGGTFITDRRASPASGTDHHAPTTWHGVPIGGRLVSCRGSFR